MAADPIGNITNFWFMGPTSIPAGIFVTGLQFLDLLPETEEKGSIADPVDFVFSGIAKFGYMLLYTACTALISLGQALLNYVIDGNFTGMSVTDFDSGSPTYNPIVAEGWGIVRNIANAALIIGLVIIAINIILGREENKAKKTLINFIIIALLINFTPVLCGLLIDASNGITKSFITGGINPAFSDEIIKSFDKITTEIPTKSIQLIFSGIIFLIFSLISFFIYILYALLFGARYVILWILVIASPIAFATRVFPQSKYIKNIFPSILYWDDWIQSFAQWCTIGIPAGLFIYLSNKMMSMAQVVPTTTTDSGDIVSSLIGGLLKYFIPLLFLIAGFFISISAGGKVGSTVEGLAKGAWAATGARAIGRARTVVSEGATGTVGAVAQGKSPLNFENREAARISIKDKMNEILPPDPSKDKEAAQDYLKTHPAAYNLRTRSSLQAASINKDFADDIDNAKTKEELEVISRNATNYGSKKNKDAIALKFAGKRDIAGGEEIYKKFVEKNEIKIENKISGMNDKTAQKELGGKQLGNYDIFKNMNAGQVTYIMQHGSVAQKQSLASNFGGGNSDFKAHMKDLYLKASDPTMPDPKAKEEYKKSKENVLAIIKNKP